MVDDAVNDWLIVNGKLTPLNSECCGVSSFSLQELRVMQNIAQDQEPRAELEEDIVWAEANKRTQIDYDFY